MRSDTKAQNFTKAVKIAIAERDTIDGWPCCIRCGAPAPDELAYSNAHYISRSHGGLGILENGLTLCPVCHKRFDQTRYRAEDREFYREYLVSHHPEWDETKLYYRRK